VHGLADDAYRPAATILRRCSDLVVAVSDDVRDRLLAAGLPAHRLRVIENAVPAPPPAREERLDVRQELEIPDDRPLVLCAARLAPPKRHDLLVDAWPRVPDAQLVLAGDGPGRAAVAARVDRSAAADRITVLGDRSDVGRLLAAADVLVLPSDREGLPMAVLEAMAAGVPVVASAVGGLCGLDRDCAVLVEPGRADALAAGLQDVLADPARRAGLAAAGLDLVRRRFSSVRMVDRYRSVYEIGLDGEESVVTKSRS